MRLEAVRPKLMVLFYGIKYRLVDFEQRHNLNAEQTLSNVYRRNVICKMTRDEMYLVLPK